MIVGSRGFLTPLCERCNSQDCSNPIEQSDVSVLGVVRKVKVYNRGDSPRFVIQCEGYMP
jgi:hypothetical protein